MPRKLTERLIGGASVSLLAVSHSSRDSYVPRSSCRKDTMNLTKDEQILCDELVRDVKAVQWPTGVVPDESTPPHVIRAACEKLRVCGIAVRFDHGAIRRATPPQHMT